MKYLIAVLLHNIRSAHNVGSIFRTSDAVGVGKVYLTGYTPKPIDRFDRAQKELAKTALGAEATVPWEYATSPIKFITRLHKDGWTVVGVEQDRDAYDYRAFTLKSPTMFVFGNEVHGLSRALCAKCDALIEIPMRGAMIRHANHPHRTRRGKESLNVSVAAGIVLFGAIASK